MKLGVIGCGKMGTALVQGAIRAGAVQPSHVIGCALSQNSRDAFTDATGATATADLAEVASISDVLLLCTKPNDITKVIAQAGTAAPGAEKLLISVAAGLTLETLEKAAPAGFRVIRCMPNTPSLVGKGAAGFCLGSRATAADAEIANSLLGAVGLAVQVPEKLMDAVTGLSGSGPAYIYLVIEALADGGVRNGLPRADALRLAAQTVLGAAAMVLETGAHPGVLKDNVTSPGGTTIAGIAELERLGLRTSMIEAVTAATRRATELGKA